MSYLRHRPLKLRIYPDPVLRQNSSPVIMFGNALQDVFQAMLAFMRERGGIGLAAPQVGVLLRIVVAHTEEGPVCLANPEILDQVGSDAMIEGCLSLPYLLADVRRSARVRIRAEDATGAPIDRVATGWLARIIQHENDHLDGKVFIDRVDILTHEDKLREWDEVRAALRGAVQGSPIGR